MTEDESDDLPEGWARASLPEVFHLNPPKPKATDHPDDTPVTFVPMPAVDAVSGTIATPSVRPFAEVRKGFTSFRNDDVILAKITPCMENGKAAVARGLTSGLGFGSTEFHVFRPTGAVLPDFLFHFIRQESFRREAEAEMTGSVGQKRVPAEHLKGVELPIPPLAEQRRIVMAVEALLAKVSSARERLERMPTTMKRFRQAVLAAACSGWLTTDWRGSGDDFHQPNDEMPDIPAKWECKPSAAIVEPGTVISYGIVLPGPSLEQGVPYVRGLDITDSGEVLASQLLRTSRAIADKHKRSVLAEGDVLLCVIRHLRVAVVPAGLDGANLTQGTVRLRPGTSIDRNFLAYFLRSPQAQAWMKARYIGMSMPRINVEHARQIPVPVPPKDEQEVIVRRVSALFALADSFEQRAASALKRVESLTQAVLAKAFRGELVPTEAELARREKRTYETADELLARIRATPVAVAKPKRARKVTG